MDTVFHALIMSKILYALCAWGGFLTQIQKGMINAFLHKMYRYKYHLVSVCFDINSIVDDMDRKFLRCCFPQSTVCIPYSLQSKAIRTGSALETTTFSSQSATVLVASLLLYIVFFGLNRFLLSFYVFLIASFHFYVCSSTFFTFSTIAMSLLLSLDLHARLSRVVQ